MVSLYSAFVLSYIGGCHRRSPLEILAFLPFLLQRNDSWIFFFFLGGNFISPPILSDVLLH